MTRSEAVKELMGQMLDDDIVIASTGYISREVFRYDRPLNFYVMGSMGAALGIGVGIAMNVNQRVFVINGDGSALMSLGTMITAKSLKLTNLYHFILDNNCHESTGAQKTNSDQVDFEMLCPNTLVFKIDKDDIIPPRITLRPSETTTRFKNALLRIQEQQETLK